MIYCISGYETERLLNTIEFCTPSVLAIDVLLTEVDLDKLIVSINNLINEIKK
jgi:hypothetical protein